LVDVSSTFTDVILDACLLPSVLPDKFGLDYMMLVAIMHSHIGIEVGEYKSTYMHAFTYIVHTCTLVLLVLFCRCTLFADFSKEI